MPLKELIPYHYNEAEQARLTELATEMAEIISKKTIQLSKQERKRYGSINETNKLIVNKIMDYRKNAPELSAPQVDWVAYFAHHDSRVFIGGFLSTMKGMVIDLSGTKMLHDYDNLQAARADYSYTKYLNERGIPGAAAKYEDLFQLFKKGRKTSEEL